MLTLIIIITILKIIVFAIKNLTFKKSWPNGVQINGEYSGEPINLTLKEAMIGYKYTLVGNNTNYAISDKPFSNNINTDGSFEYNPELLPIFHAYVKESIENKKQQQQEEMMMMC